MDVGEDEEENVTKREMCEEIVKSGGCLFLASCQDCPIRVECSRRNNLLHEDWKQRIFSQAKEWLDDHAKNEVLA